MLASSLFSTVTNILSQDCSYSRGMESLYVSPTYTLSVFLCFFCTILNITLLVKLASGEHVAINIVTSRNEAQNLRRPSQYIHLDSIQYPLPPVHREFMNRPILVSTVDSGQPDKVAEVDSRRYMSPNGMISPPERHVMITDTVRACPATIQWKE